MTDHHVCLICFAKLTPFWSQASVTAARCSSWLMCSSCFQRVEHHVQMFSLTVTAVSQGCCFQLPQVSQ